MKMKKQTLILLWMVGALGAASGQHVVVSTYLEKNHMSTKTGTTIGFESASGIEYGGFYQESSLLEKMSNTIEGNTQRRLYEREFYGLYFAGKISEMRKVDLSAMVRTGLSNGKYLVITPNVIGRYKPTKSIGVGMGLGMRALRPTYQGFISIKM